MNYLHVAIIEDFEECLISASEEGLHGQVNAFLIKNSITPPTKAEWAVCVVGRDEKEIPIESDAAAGLITYYKVGSLMEKEQIIEKLKSMG
jgi:hypothetical protein